MTGGETRRGRRDWWRLGRVVAVALLGVLGLTLGGAAWPAPPLVEGGRSAYAIHRHGAQSLLLTSGNPIASYILARQMWDAGVAVDDLYREWLKRAYGPRAAAPMDRLYRRLEAAFTAYKRTEGLRYRGANYEINSEKIRAVYVPLWPEIERLYEAAVAGAVTATHRQRLEEFGDELSILHYHMRRAGLFPAAERSRLCRDDEAVKRLPGFERTVPIYVGEWNGERTVYERP